MTKKIILVFLLIARFTLSMELPSSSTHNFERVFASLQLLHNKDISFYKTLGCYDSSEQMVQTLAQHLPTLQVYWIDLHTKKRTEYSRPSSFLYKCAAFLYLVPQIPHELPLVGKYDMVLCPFALIFSKDRKQIIEHMHACLKSGGQLIARGFPKISPYDALSRALNELIKQEKWNLHLRDFSLNQYELSFSEAKILFPAQAWRNVSVEATAVTAALSDTTSVQHWISQWIDEFPFNPPLSTDNKQELISDFIQQYALKSANSYSSAHIVIEAYKK